MLIIDRQAKEQVYRQLYRQIRAEIETGVRQPQAKMPSTRYLAQQLGVSRNTVDHAYQDLVAEGYLTSKPASGYRVCARLPFIVAAPATPAVPAARFRYDFTESFDYRRLFPTQAWQAAELAVLRRGSAHIQPAAGDRDYRQQLVHYLARLKGIHVQPEQVVVTSGFNEAAGIIAHLLPGIDLAVAEPIAPNARAVWQTLGVSVQSFRDPQKLPDAAGYVLAPTHNFPDGRGYTRQQRQALAAWLDRHERYLIELDTDGTLVDSDAAAPAIHHDLEGARAFYYTNFDETLGSSLCAGVLVLPAALVARYQQVYGKLPNRNSQLQQQILSQMIASDDLERYLRQLTVVYHNRRQLLLDTLHAAFGARLRPLGTAAGSFVTLALTAKQSVPALIAQAAAAGVGLVDPDRCWVDLKPAYPSFVMSFRQTDDDTIVAGVAALAAAWKHVLV